VASRIAEDYLVCPGARVFAFFKVLLFGLSSDLRVRCRVCPDHQLQAAGDPAKKGRRALACGLSLTDDYRGEDEH
jgi:hypothetical protein